MSAPVKCYCKQFIEKGTTRKLTTGGIADDTLPVKNRGVC